MGYQTLGRCYETSSEATDAFFSSVAPSVSASPPVQVVFTKSSGDWFFQTYSMGTTASLQSSTPAVAPSFPSCSSLDQFLDGVALGWGVAGAMILAWAVSFLRRPLRA